MRMKASVQEGQTVSNEVNLYGYILFMGIVIIQVLKNKTLFNKHN
jgi:hypothetical protein